MDVRRHGSELTSGAGAEFHRSHMSNMSFLLPAPKRDILAVVLQSQRLCLRRQ
jgi:hypothetical protein